MSADNTPTSLPRDIVPVHWYPGHIAKVERELNQHLQLCDVVIELLDARLPNATTNRRLQAKTKDKPSIVVLNKADLGDPAKTEEWKNALAQQHLWVATATSTRPPTVKTLANQVIKLGKPIQAARAKKGLKPRPLRALVCGMPNVGKSTLINALIGHKKAKTGHKAGVTRQPQWIRIHPQIELLDTPGVIPPQLEVSATVWPSVGMLLAMVSSVGDAAYDECPMAQALLEHMDELYPGRCREFYQFPSNEPWTLAALAHQRGWLGTGGQPDELRAAQAVLADFRQGRWGRVTLEWLQHD